MNLVFLNQGQAVTDSSDNSDMERLEKVLTQIENTLHKSYHEPSKLEDHLSDLKISEVLFYNFPLIHNALRETVMKNFTDSRPKEADIHNWFSQHLNTILPDYKITKRINNPKHIPDFWLSESEGCFIPVEIKLNSFDSRHLAQLLRYMNFYKCDSGIAVGARLNCYLPSNVAFIKHELEWC